MEAALSVLSGAGLPYLIVAGDDLNPAIDSGSGGFKTATHHRLATAIFRTRALQERFAKCLATTAQWPDNSAYERDAR